MRLIEMPSNLGKIFEIKCSSLEKSCTKLEGNLVKCKTRQSWRKKNEELFDCLPLEHLKKHRSLKQHITH